MVKLIRILVVGLIISFLIVLFYFTRGNSIGSPETSEPFIPGSAEAKLYELNKLEKAKLEYKEFIKKTMELSNPKLSETKKTLTIEKVTNAAFQYLTKPEDREAFVVIIRIESNFDNNARSKVGAVGIGQIMPQYAVKFGEICSIKINKEDIYDADINLAVSACLFNSLIKEYGSYFLAVSAYNGGSAVAEKYKKLSDINNETSNYVARFALVREQIRGK